MRNREVLIFGVVWLVCAAEVLLHTGLVAKVPAGLLLVVVLPALVADRALRAMGGRRAAGLRLATALGTSIALAIFAALVLAVSPLGLGAAALVAAEGVAVALIGLYAVTGGRAPAYVARGRTSTYELLASRVVLGVGVVAAGGLAVLALHLARHSALADSPRMPQLSVQSRDDEPQIVLANPGGAQETFRVRIKPRQTAPRVVAVPGGGEKTWRAQRSDDLQLRFHVVATVIGGPYRGLTLSVGSGGMAPVGASTG